mmetsp:Transcript_7135/g.13520  ORF Transcript_7135/g.13520 Transcript_7135/m.13520 type:complete len:395 (+) Transcript_7135:3978-5162(+)
MALFIVKPSLPLSILFAFLSGLLFTLSTASTHLPAHIDSVATRLEQEEEQKLGAKEKTTTHTDDETFVDNIIEASTRPVKHKKTSKRMWKVAYASNLLFAALSGILSLVGTWFGPISLFVPLKHIAQILSGMVIFSYILRTDPKPSKDTAVGNYIIVLSSIMLIFVGPEVKGDPDDAVALLSQRRAIMTGATLLIVGFVFCFPYQFILGCTNVSANNNRYNFVGLLVTEVVHAVIGNSCSKLFHLLKGPYFIANTVILVLSIFTITYSSVLRSTIIPNQTDYVPLEISANIFLNGIVGMLIWEDHIINIGGYTVLYLFFLMGVYLVSDYEILPGTFLKDNNDHTYSSIIYRALYGKTRNVNIQHQAEETDDSRRGQVEESSQSHEDRNSDDHNV